MISDKKELLKGISLMVVFVVVLVLIFTPLFQGENGLTYLDNLFNSISKGSAHYIPDLKKQAGEYSGEKIQLEFPEKTSPVLNRVKFLFRESGAKVVSGNQAAISGNLKDILMNCLDDSESMYRNQGNRIREKYGYDEKEVLYTWWLGLELMDKKLKKEKRFGEAAFILEIQKKAVETSYNYYGIEPENITRRFGVVLFSLVFYVLYTLLYGFAVMFIFIGWGMKLEHE